MKAAFYQGYHPPTDILVLSIGKGKRPSRYDVLSSKGEVVIKCNNFADEERIYFADRRGKSLKNVEVRDVINP